MEMNEANDNYFLLKQKSAFKKYRTGTKKQKYLLKSLPMLHKLLPITYTNFYLRTSIRTIFCFLAPLYFSKTV